MRNGKIARLPRVVREELNRRMREGEMGKQLVGWLNELPEVRSVMAAQFGGRRVRAQNLSEWRKRGGYAEWVLREEAFRSFDPSTLRQAQGLAAGSGPCGKETGGQGEGVAFAEKLAQWVTARYTIAARWVEEAQGAERWRRLREFCADVVALRRGDHRARRLEMVRERRERAKPESIRVNPSEIDAAVAAKRSDMAKQSFAGEQKPAHTAQWELPPQVRSQALSLGTRRQVGANSDQRQSESIRVNPSEFGGAARGEETRSSAAASTGVGRVGMDRGETIAKPAKAASPSVSSEDFVMTYLRPTLLSILATFALPAGLIAADDGFTTIFDGKSLKGWHVSTKSGHSRVSGGASGGKWEVKDGAITGTQDPPKNGGLVLTDEQYSEFEVVLEMNNDFGPDSGLFLRSTEDGKCYQALVDYHGGGSLMGIYGEGLGGKPHVRFFSFGATPSEITLHPDRTPSGIPVDAEGWKKLWKPGQWNELRARITGGDKPTITTWINGVKIMEWTETEARLPLKGSIGLQVHGGGDAKDYDGKYVRYRNVRVKKLGADAGK